MKETICRKEIHNKRSCLKQTYLLYKNDTTTSGLAMPLLQRGKILGKHRLFCV